VTAARDDLVVLEIPARTEYLSVARAVVAAAASVQPTLDEEQVEDLRIAVTEAVTNAVEAHADLGSDELVIIRCDLGEDRVEVEVQDRGPGFSPDDLPDLPEPEDPARLEYESGLGLQLIRELTDEHEVRTSDSGTAVRLVVSHARDAAWYVPPT
jgi:serine/threonine-protein kinase RsbW